MAGFNSVSINSRNTDYVGLIKGFNSTSPSLEYNQAFKVIDEDGNVVTELVTITVSSAQGSYEVTTDTGFADFYVYTAAFLPIEHTVTVTNGILSRSYTFTPVFNELRELPLTRVKFDPLSIYDAIGNIDSVASVVNAVLTDTTGWETDSPKTITFPLASLVSSDGLFYFGRQEADLNLNVDITYQAIVGRDVTENIDIKF